MKSVIVAGIRLYRKWISPGLPASCRFVPTCSAYSMEAVARHGAIRGSALAVRRLSKCHPWHPGGYDPVPAAGKTKTPEHRSDGEEFLQDQDCCDKTAFILTAPRAPRPAPLKR